MSECTRAWERLAAAGIVAGPAPADAAPEAPWYVSAMQGVAAWLAALFLLAFIGVALSDLLREPVARILVGVTVCAGAITVLRLGARGTFASQLAVAAGLAGQALVAFGLLDGRWDRAPAWVAVAAFEALLVVAAPEPLFRALATMGAAFAARMALAAAGMAALFPAALALALVVSLALPQRRAGLQAQAAPVVAGLALALLAAGAVAMVEGGFGGAHAARAWGAVPAWVGTVALAAVFVGAVAWLLRGAGAAWTAPPSVAALVGAVAVTAAAWPMPGAVVALLVLLLAFAAGRRTLAGLAVAALIGALAHYYYALEATLLAKSAALLVTGVVLAGAYVVARRIGGAAREADHA